MSAEAENESTEYYERQQQAKMDALVHALLGEALYGLEASCIAISVIPLDYTGTAKCVIGVRDAVSDKPNQVATLTASHGHEITELLRLNLEMQAILFAMLQSGCKNRLSALSRERHQNDLAIIQVQRDDQASCKEIEKQSHEQTSAGKKTSNEATGSAKNN